MQSVILAAGRGKRMMELTEECPKPLMKVNGKTILEIILKQLSQTGVTEVVIVVKHCKEKIIEKIGNNIYGMKVIYAEQQDTKGTAQAVLTAEPYIKDDKFFVIAGDSLFPTDVLERLKNHPNADAVLTVCKIEDPRKFGTIEPVNGKVKKIVEKSENPPSNLANISIYFFPKAIFNFCKQVPLSPRNEYEITDAIQALIDQNNIVEYEIIEKGLDIGTREHIEKAQNLAKDLF